MLWVVVLDALFAAALVVAIIGPGGFGVQLAASIAAVALSWFSATHLIRMLDQRPALAVDDEGITYVTLLARRSVPWAEVDSVSEAAASSPAVERVTIRLVDGTEVRVDDLASADQAEELRHIVRREAGGGRSLIVD